MSEGAHSQRRARHITSLQVRNLTAFPVRDAFASALSQPAEQPQFNAPGYLADDLDVTLSRKRSRRISTNSVATYKSYKSDESVDDPEPRGRRAAGSRLSFHSAGSVGPRFSTASAAPTVRGHRPRTSSMTSSLNSALHSSSVLPTTTASFSTTLPDHSQTGLEKVIKARLFETFLTVSVESPPPLEHGPPPTSPAKPSTPPRSPKPSNGVPPRKGVKPSPLSPTEKTPAGIRRESPLSPSSPSKHTPKSPSLSGLSRPNGKRPASPRKPPTAPTSVASPAPPSSTLPDYISPIHRPSTNPSFDTRSGYESGPWIDPSGHKMKVELWGRIDPRATEPAGKGKQKEQDTGEPDWRILEEWQVDLGSLLPLPDDLQLPSNTLVVTLHPPGRTFYLPPALPSDRRSPTPSMDAGYASDPESSGRAGRKSPTVQFSPETDVVAQSRRRHRRVPGAVDSEGERSKTANWQDLFKLVTLQSCIQDNEVSLTEIVREIDKVLEGDTTWALKREVSEREASVQALRRTTAALYDQSEILKEEIELRRQQLQERREMFALAQELGDEDLTSTEEMQEAVAATRTELGSLQSRFTPTRTTLISSLSTIFPIELLSPPDLLYSILGVPLPIPLSASDPAPPLSLPAHRDVTEDAVATALGYVAQVVQLLAAYLGKGLVYPITCIGSRSMIRDGISAMVGPRMFPLFSKGVDTYRFEYGVFLLNKDIELLMADRDLRALDMRHTLPNLKNLLLTLTDGEGAQLSVARSLHSPEPFVTGLESPRGESPVENESTTPKLAQSSEHPAAESTTPPASGSTTPTTEMAKKSRSFIGLSPIAGFLRARYPSAILIGSSAKSVTEESEVSVGEEADTLADDDDEDRRTIRGDAAAASTADEGVNGVVRGSEKLGDVPSHTPPTSPPPVTPIKFVNKGTVELMTCTYALSKVERAEWPHQ
ncbi:UV radiation resistance protein and autophagy-related subunit 14-domain-containing protein [Roridomyces roridus]|uniref:Autophagy-related protein 14 n=1 Tax=Roridomyces roridus TaxID=1738132 RepID=A0AAD7BTF1_9AGAR|nr:UV radiation resistance protein and autophagy-related subunit 14-domain-containing protein [Roridomyces roridus]